MLSMLLAFELDGVCTLFHRLRDCRMQITTINININVMRNSALARGTEYVYVQY